jgi:hypothetical protein
VLVSAQIKHALDHIVLLATVQMVDSTHLAEDVEDFLVFIAKLFKFVPILLTEPCHTLWQEWTSLQNSLDKPCNLGILHLTWHHILRSLIVYEVKNGRYDILQMLRVGLKYNHALLVGKLDHALVTLTVVFYQDGKLVPQNEVLGADCEVVYSLSGRVKILL